MNDTNTVIKEWDLVPSGKMRSAVIPNMVITAILFAFYISPLLSRNVHIFIKLAFLVLWVVTAIQLPTRKTMCYPKAMLQWWGAYVIWMLAMCVVGHSSTPLPQFIRHFPLYCSPFMMTSIVRSYNLKEMKWLWAAFICLFAINLAHNYWIGFTQPELFDLVKAKDGDTTGFISNAGGSDFVYLCMFLVPIFWIVWQSSEEKRTRILSVIFIVFASGYFVFINSRTTATVTLFLMIIMFILVKRAGVGQGHIVKIVAGLVIVALLLSVFSRQIFSFALDFFEDSARMSNRLEDLFEVSQGADLNDMDDGSLGARYLLWMTSVNTFLSSVPNFLIGIGDDVHEGDILSLVRYGVGCHSEFFDLAARYGIVGIFLVFNFLKNAVKYFGRLAHPGNQRSNMIVFFIIWCLSSFVNNSIALPYFYAILILFPISLMLVNNHKI